MSTELYWIFGLFLLLYYVLLSVKSARNMIFSVLAQEEEDDVRVLSYAPGPVDTPMQEFIRRNVIDPEMKKMFTGNVPH